MGTLQVCWKYQQIRCCYSEQSLYGYADGGTSGFRVASRDCNGNCDNHRNVPVGNDKWHKSKRELCYCFAKRTTL